MPRLALHAPEAQPVTFVELFFDLVFVFAVTQVTVLTAHHLDAGGVARSAVLFWLIWWAWTQFTWTLNPADTRHTVVRATTLAATGAAFVMAASVPLAFAADPMWFAVPYVVIRLIGLALQVRVGREHAAGDKGISMIWVYVSLLGLVVVLVGATVAMPGRTWVWVGAIALDFLAGGLAGQRAEWDLHQAHFSERHGLFVIIALGESLIVAGTAVAGDARSAELVAAAGACLVVACLLWWTYFGWLKEAIEEGFAEVTADQLGPVARDAYSFAHFPLICGIIGFAVAVEETVLHPDEAMATPVLVALVAGIGLFIGASALSYWRVTHEVLGARLAILGATLGLALLADADPVWTLSVVAVGLLAIVVTEEVTIREETPAEVHLD